MVSPRRAFLMAVGLGWALGCVTFDYTDTRCSGNQECPSGYVCKGGLCTTDAGVTVPDAGTPDAGTVCPSGCVDQRGACQPGTANDACGETGPCVACGAMEVCATSGGGRKCAPRCPSGCLASNQTCRTTDQDVTACGADNSVCTSCPVPPAGQSYACAAERHVRALSSTPDAGTALRCDTTATTPPITATAAGTGIITYQLSAPVTQVAAADLDSDGLDEVVVVHPNLGLRLLRNVDGSARALRPHQLHRRHPGAGHDDLQRWHRTRLRP